MPELPSGTVTFLFTDVEGSTKLWEEHAADAGAMLARHDEAARLFGAASAVRDEIGAQVWPTFRAMYDADIETARAAAGPEFQKAWDEGRALNFNEAVELALGETGEALKVRLRADVQDLDQPDDDQVDGNDEVQ